MRSILPVLVTLTLFSSLALGQTVVQIIDSSGDGQGHPLLHPRGVSVDDDGNVFVVGRKSHNAFRITPEGGIMQIIDAVGDRHGHGLSQPWRIRLDRAGNAYVSGGISHNVFRVTPGGVITQIIDRTGDGVNVLLYALGVIADSAGVVYVAGSRSHNVFRITPRGQIREIIDESGDGAENRLKRASPMTSNIFARRSSKSSAEKSVWKWCFS